MNAAARLWQALTSLNLRSAVLPPMPPRSAETPQMWLERIEREHRHSWLPDPALSGPCLTCSVCGFSVGTSPMTTTLDGTLQIDRDEFRALIDRRIEARDGRSR